MVKKVCRINVTYIQLRKLNPIFDKVCAGHVNGLLEKVRNKVMDKKEQ